MQHFETTLNKTYFVKTTGSLGMRQKSTIQYIDTKDVFLAPYYPEIACDIYHNFEASPRFLVVRYFH